MLMSILCIKLLYINQNQLYAVSRTQQDRQEEPSVKTLRYPLSAEYWRHCMFSGGTQRPLFASIPENISLP